MNAPGRRAPAALLLSASCLVCGCSGILDAGSDVLEDSPGLSTDTDASNAPPPVVPVPDAGFTPAPDAAPPTPTADASASVSDAGSDAAADAGEEPASGLPVDLSSPVVLCNDGAYDNWQGEFAALLVAKGLQLEGIIAGDSRAWTDLQANVTGWQDMVNAARASGLQNLPDVTASDGPTLNRPASGVVEDTVPNASPGASLIVELASNLPPESPPLAVVVGGRLTDVADAYLMDPGIVDRVVVIPSIGTTTEQGAELGIPNGEMDPWANTIIVRRMRYIMVSAHYDHFNDVPDARLADLPNNAFGNWMTSKQDQILTIEVAADQVGVLALALPGFATNIGRVSESGSITLDFGESPTLAFDEAGDGWLVSGVDGELARETLWQLLSEQF